MSNEIQVWVGFSDDKPHLVQHAGCNPTYSIYRTRAAAKAEYEDVRPAMLAMNTPAMRAAKKAKRSRK